MNNGYEKSMVRTFKNALLLEVYYNAVQEYRGLQIIGGLVYKIGRINIEFYLHDIKQQTFRYSRTETLACFTRICDTCIIMANPHLYDVGYMGIRDGYTTPVS